MKTMLKHKENQRGNKWLEFFKITSLHGYGYLFRENKPFSHTVGWAFVIITAMIGVSVLLYINIDEFIRSSVTYNLDSPTTPLSEVYFPSIVICNMNKLRKSFIFSLLEDPTLSHMKFHDLLRIIDNALISGKDANVGHQDLSDEESKIIDAIFNSTVYEELFQELLTQARTPNASFGNIPIAKPHFLSSVDVNEDTLPNLKQSTVLEIASQFRERDLVVQVNFTGFGAFYSSQFTTDVSDTCVWFTPYWKEPKDMFSLLSVEKSVRNGANNGFQILLDAESYDYASSSAGTDGFVIAIIHHLDIPIVKHIGIQIETGHSVQIAVTPFLINTTDQCRKRFTPEKRQCYFEDEISLRHFPRKNGFRYDMSNCLFEATLQKVEKLCGCTSPQFQNEDLEPSYHICNATRRKCMNNLLDFIGNERTIDDEGVTKPCLAACENQKHNFFVTSAGYPNIESFHLTDDFCVVLEKIRTSCSQDRMTSLKEWDEDLCPIIEQSRSWDCESLRNNQATNISQANLKKTYHKVAHYAEKNMARVNVYIRDPYVKRYVTEEKITEISFVGNIGGLLGLFVGFSFISAAEFVYYLIVVGNCKSDQFNSRKKKVEQSGLRNARHKICH